MLIHNACGAPVEVLDDEFVEGAQTLSLLRFYCQICKTEVADDHDLVVVDSLGLLKETL